MSEGMGRRRHRAAHRGAHVLRPHRTSRLQDRLEPAGVGGGRLPHSLATAARGPMVRRSHAPTFARVGGTLDILRKLRCGLIGTLAVGES